MTKMSEYAGFEAAWTLESMKTTGEKKAAASVTCSGPCPCGLHGPSSGSFSDGPGNYGSRQTCSWLVASSMPTKIMVAFTSFDTNSHGYYGDDFVTINECSSASCETRSELARLSGGAQDDICILGDKYRISRTQESDLLECFLNASTVYTASTGFLEVVFESQGRGGGKYAGFEAVWRMEMMTECSECMTWTYTNTSGSSSCTGCPAGSFQNATGATQCFTCDCGKKVERKYCEGYCTQREKEEERTVKEIHTVDLALVVVGLVCELLTSISLRVWNGELTGFWDISGDPTNFQHIPEGSHRSCLLSSCGRMTAMCGYLMSTLIFFCGNPLSMCFVADLCFSLAKLFPGSPYNCDSWSCRKVTHSCTMTLCAFPFQVFEVWILKMMVKQQGSRVPVLLKIVEYLANLAFLLHDAATSDPPGVGTIVLVVIASLAEVLLIAFEAHTFFKYR